ncbi:type II toxin-antitoxin system VapC family toxin [Methylicorpusculum oleiharenae]|uniref:type II toxin-antitoxin system VapC family toxin n=1 Tax=Methylicorpusculum oleiharenae TaxID=1338687 RepID=UPI001356A036|nr:type II toxin-antitoxin system VapC family toxin [Methylicorpusculum oleiharenae]MCD2449004.1 type II toxin-antitoxin system VapC family toxin [Methylicorpusculum oleiharenae]
MQRYVIDSPVFNKLYLDEADRDKAQHLFIKAASAEIMLLAPDLLYLEVVNTAQRCGVPIDAVVELLEAQRYLMQMRALTNDERNLALQIIGSGHDKSGYPSIYDAIFHAMALCNNAVLVTADKRHYAKTQELGSIRLLSELKV